MLSHRGLFAGARTNCAIGNARTTDRILITMPLFHVGATIMYLGYSVVGAAIVLHRAFDATASLRAVEEHMVTHLHTAPTMIHTLLETAETENFDTSSLTNILYSSSPMSDILLRRGIERFGPIFTQIYGMTECVGGTALQPFQHVLAGNPKEVGRLASAGQANIDSFIRILADDGSECSSGAVGEIVVSGPSMMQGYWNNPSQTQKVLQDGWFHTGDLGYLDDEDYLFIVDRKKDMIVSGGENIYSREVEAALMMHPEVSQVAVIGVPDRRWGKSSRRSSFGNPAARLARMRSSPTAANRLRATRSRKAWNLSALPQLPSGKVDKKILPLPIGASRPANSNVYPAMTFTVPSAPLMRWRRRRRTR